MPAKQKYAVITADIVGSRRIKSFRPRRDEKLRMISDLHVRRKLILSSYAVTAWDEFQAILKKSEYVPSVILDLRRLFYPFELWIAVGIGLVSEAHKRPVNVYAGGEAFERAREAADRLKAGNSKYRVLTAFNSGNQILDAAANTIYHLHDTLLEGVTARQWATINVQLETRRQDITARKLKVDVSTVSRNLKRGHFWQILETQQAMERIIAGRS